MEKIIVEKNHVRGVIIKGCGQFDTAAVISTASGMLTFGLLIDTKHVPSRIGAKLQHPHLSHSAVSIQLGLTNKIAAPAHSVSVLPWMEHQQDLFSQDGSEMKFPVYLVPTLTMPELAPKGGKSRRGRPKVFGSMYSEIPKINVPTQPNKLRLKL